jgi:hypothetical protein
MIALLLMMMTSEEKTVVGGSIRATAITKDIRVYFIGL